MKNPYSRNGKTVLFTCQNKKTLDIIEKTGKFSNKKIYIQEKFGDIAETILKSYDWFVYAADRRVRKPADVEYQIWCTASSKTSIKPEEDEVLYILEVPDEEIIFFNCFRWDYVLNLHYLPEDDEDLKKYQMEMKEKGFSNTYEFINGKYSGMFPLEVKRIRESWNRVFEITEWNDFEIQANIWEIKKEWIKAIVRHGENIPEKYRNE